ncbi:hypothetical protein P835_04089 [Citrobacter portucalensis]|nr:hypothetical protein P835_04089 [Citrobacter portucalensis]
MSLIKSPGAYIKYATGVSEESQHRCGLKDDVYFYTGGRSNSNTSLSLSA